MAENIGDINLNINVNVRGAAGLQSIQTGLQNIQAQGAKVAKSISGVTGSMRTQAAQAGTLKDRLDSAEKQYDAIFRASYRLQNVGYGLINVSKEMFGIISNLTDQWGNFEFMINRAAGAMQVFTDSGSKANPIYEALIENVYSLSKELRIFPATDVAKAVYYWASTTGQQVNSMNDLKTVMQAVNPLMKEAALTETSYEQTIKGVYSILVQYHKGLDQTGDVTAKLNLVTQRTALEFSDLINSFKFVGPVAGALGVTFEEVASTLGAIGDAGIRGTQAGRALRQMFIQTAKPTAKAQALLDNVFRSTNGLRKGFEELVFPEGKFVGITKYTQYLAMALQHATVRDRQFFLASITTANELPVLTSLVENQIRALNGSADAYDNTKASVDDATNATVQFNKQWELLSTSWKGVIGRLREGAEVIKLRVGRQIAESLKPAVDKMSEFLDKVDRWVKRNPEVIATVGRFAAGLGALAAVAGGLFVLAGSLLGLYAAVNIIVKGFAPLFAIGSAALGAIVALAEAIIRNWTRIQRVVVPAINRFMNALTGGRGGIEAMKAEMEKLHKAVSDFADTIVRFAIKAIEALLNIMTSIANSPFRPIIEAVAKAMLAAFGARSILMILGFGAALTNILKVLFIVRAGALGTAVQLRFLGASAFFATLEAKGLTAALQTMSKTTILIVLTAVILVIQTLIDLLPRTKQDVDALNESYKDFLFTIGKGSKALDEQIQSIIGLAPKMAEIQAQIDAINTKKYAPRDISGSVSKAKLQKQLEDLQASSAELQAKWQASFQSIADDSERSLSEVVDIVEKYGPKIFGPLNTEAALTNAQAFTKEYFKVLGDDSVLSAKKAIKIWNDLIAKGVKPKTDAATFLRTVVSPEELKKAYADLDATKQLDEVAKDLKAHSFAMATNILIGLKSGADTYSDDINTQVTNLLNGIPKAYSAVEEEVTALATKTPQEILDALVAGFKSLGDVGKQIKAALKAGPITGPKLVKGLFGDITGKDTTSALTSKFAQFNLIGLAAIDNAHTQFVNAVNAYERVGKEGNLAAAIKKQLGPAKFLAIFAGTYKGKDWKKLTPEQQAGLQEMVDWAATQMGLIKPTPAVITGVTQTLNSKTSRLFAAEFGATADRMDTPQGADPISNLVAQMKDPWEKQGKPFVDSVTGYITNAWSSLNAYFASNPDPLGELASAMSKSLTAPGGVEPTTDAAAKYISDHLAGQSPPPVGPLSTIDKGGLATMLAWVGGFSAGIPAAILAAIATTTLVQLFMTPPLFSLFNGGSNVMKSWIDGMVHYWDTEGRSRLHSVLTEIKRLQVGNSPPPTGPLKDIGKGGYNIGKAWAEGMMSGSGLAVKNAMTTASLVRSALSLEGPNAPSLVMTAATDRVIKVEVDVSSKDGSVDALTVQQLKTALTSDDLVRSLQHMATAKG